MYKIKIFSDQKIGGKQTLNTSFATSRTVGDVHYYITFFLVSGILKKKLPNRPVDSCLHPSPACNNKTVRSNPTTTK